MVEQTAKLGRRQFFSATRKKLFKSNKKKKKKEFGIRLLYLILEFASNANSKLHSHNGHSHNGHSDNGIRGCSRLFRFPFALKAPLQDTTMPQQQQVTKRSQEGLVFLKVESRKKFKRQRKHIPLDLAFPTFTMLPPLPVLATPLNQAIFDLTCSSDEEENTTEFEYWSLISFLFTFQVKTSILPTKPFLFFPKNSKRWTNTQTSSKSSCSTNSRTGRNYSHQNCPKALLLTIS